MIDELVAVNELDCSETPIHTIPQEGSHRPRAGPSIPRGRVTDSTVCTIHDQLWAAEPPSRWPKQIGSQDSLNEPRIRLRFKLREGTVNNYHKFEYVTLRHPTSLRLDLLPEDMRQEDYYKPSFFELLAQGG